MPLQPSATESEPLKNTGPAKYPEPLVIFPIFEHRYTFIILHGRGSNASTFVPEFLSTAITSSQTLPTSFSHAKFIFPTACKRRAAMYNRATITQWFDHYSLDTPTEREELQIDGLKDSNTYIHGLLKKEIKIVGAENVVLGGLSQGCAASLVSLLIWDGEPLVAAFGLCGWLPFRKQMEEIARREEVMVDEVGDGDPFARSDEQDNFDPLLQAVEFLREELGMDDIRPSMSFKRTPLFLGHGKEDEKVSVHLGREATRCLEVVGLQVLWREYDGLAHWYSPAMLSDMSAFLHSLGLGNATLT